MRLDAGDEGWRDIWRDRDILEEIDEERARLARAPTLPAEPILVAPVEGQFPKYCCNSECDWPWTQDEWMRSKSRREWRFPDETLELVECPCCKSTNSVRLEEV